MDKVIKCSQCAEEIHEDEYYACYYSCEYSEENILCGEGDCWAMWMQMNTYSHRIEREGEE